MNKKVAVFWIFQAFLFGTVVGLVLSHIYYSFSHSNVLVGSSAVEAGHTVGTLTRYRMGKETNVVELLETHLDMQLVRLDTLLAENPASIKDRGVWTMLKSARDYRAKFPHQAKSPQIDKATARVFGLLEE